MPGIHVLTIDLAKRSFQTCATDRGGTVLFDRAVSRAKLEQMLKGQVPLFYGDTILLCGQLSGEGCDLWAKGPGDYVAISAKATGEVRHAN